MTFAELRAEQLNARVRERVPYSRPGYFGVNHEPYSSCRCACHERTKKRRALAEYYDHWVNYFAEQWRGK